MTVQLEREGAYPNRVHAGDGQVRPIGDMHDGHEARHSRRGPPTQGGESPSEDVGMASVLGKPRLMVSPERLRIAAQALLPAAGPAVPRPPALSAATAGSWHCAGRRFARLGSRN